MPYEVKLKEWSLFKPNRFADYNTHYYYYERFGLPTSFIFLSASYIAI